MKKKRQNHDGNDVKAVNKKAKRDFIILETIEAGLELLGTEVKSLREGQVDLSGSYGRVQNEQCWLVGTNIAQYQQAAAQNHEPERKRKLLLHKSEIRKITIKLEQRGFTLVPLRIYFNEKGLAKIELALAKGKRKYDKRKKIDEKTQKRDIDRDIKKYRR